jgi:hypothetical protein
MADATVEQGGIADSVMGSGAVTSPTAGQVIAATAALPAGVYSVLIVTCLAGTAPVAADFSNLQLKHGAVGAGGLLAATTPLQMERERITVAASEAVTVNAVAAGTVGTIYAAFVSATRIA